MARTPLTEPKALLLLLAAGVAAALGQVCVAKAYTAGEPALVSVVGLMQIVFALAFDLLSWRRQFGPLVVVGIALVVAPSAWLMLRSPLRRQSAAVHTTG